MNISQLNSSHALSAVSVQSAKKEPVTDLHIIAQTNSTNTAQSSPEHSVHQAAQKIQETVNNLAQNLRFSVDEDTGKNIVKVIDTQTNEVIRQIPSKEAVEIARTLDKVQGLLFNDKA